MSNVDIVRHAYEAMTHRDVETVIILLDPQDRDRTAPHRILRCGVNAVSSHRERRLRY